MKQSTEVREQVQRIRTAMLERYGVDADSMRPDEQNETAIDRAAKTMMVSAHWGIASDIPIFGSALVLTRRIMRILLRWYINPIVEQQNQFNAATVAALYELQSQNDAIRADLHQAESRSQSENIER